MDYTIDSKIGSGSFGVVYKAHDRSGRRCAVKLVKPGGSGAKLGASLLRTQYELLSSLTHARIVRALDFDADSSHGPMLVTEMLDGVDLKTYVETRGIGDLVLITAMVLDGLRYLHSLGKVHGDLKPDSIIVSDLSGSIEVTLIDAGFDYGRGSKLPTLEGTLAYLAPEITRHMPGDGRSDLYSLGVILHEMLTGRCPFGGAGEEEILENHLELVPDDPSSLNPDVEVAWDEFVGTLLKKEAFLRYNDAVHAGLELERLFGPSTVFLDNVLPPDSAVLVGRDEEIKGLKHCLLPSRGKGVIVRSQRGWGVSRVLHEIECLARLSGYKVHTVSLDEKMPGFAQVVDAILGDGAAAAGTPAGLEPGSGGSEADYLDRLLGACYSNLSPDRKHLLAIDRGEVMDQRELRMLGTIAARLGDLVSVVIGYQTDEPPAEKVAGHEIFETVRLEPLDRGTLNVLLKSYFGVSAVPDDLLEELHSVSGGNPDFVGLMLKHLWSTGSVRIEAKQGVLEVVWDRTMGIPNTVRDVMQERLRGLSPQASEVLKFICVGVGQIETTLLAGVSSEGKVDRALRELIGSGLVEVSEDKTSVRLKWKNLTELIRDTIPPETLKDASLRLASFIEAKPGSCRDYFVLGTLYLDGGERERAFAYLVQAGDYFAGFSARDAISAYAKALQCGAGSDQVAEVEEKIGTIKLARGDAADAAVHFERAATSRPSAARKMGWVAALRGALAEAAEILSRCETAAGQAGDVIETAMIRSDLGHVRSLESRKDLALDLLRQARAVFIEQGMPGEAGRAANRIGIAEMRSANFKGAARAWIEAIADFEQAGDSKTAAVCLMNLGLCHRKQMDFDRADDALKRALAVFDELKALHERASCCQNYAILMLDLGNLSGALGLAGEALSLNTLLGRSAGVVAPTILLSAIAIESGNWVEAEKRLSELLEDGPFLDDYHLAMVKRYLAATSAMRGKCGQAVELIDESHDLACKADDAEGQGQAMLQKGEILLRCDRPKEALRVARKALVTLGLASSPLLADEAQRVVGEALAVCGDTEAAIAELMQARQGFEGLPESLHIGRVFRALALALYREGDHESFTEYINRSIEIFRNANARYDYAVALLLGGSEASDRGNLLQARHYLLEAARILETLDIKDLHERAVCEMDRIPAGDLETRAVSSLSKISETLSSSHDLTTVLNLAMDLAIEYLGAERGALMLEDDGTGDLKTFVERKMDRESLREVMGISGSIVESVRSSGESVIEGDATKDPRFKDSQSVRIHNVMSVMCVPLTMGSKFLGIIYLDSRGVPSSLSTLEKAFVEAFANQVSLAIENARLVGKLHEDVADLKTRAREKYSHANIIGPGKKMQEVFRKVEIAAGSEIRVMLTGENGTGKEEIARLIHERSQWSDKPLVIVNCAAIHHDLIETELFGIEERVATGVSSRSGIFERADGGTVFLDEIGDMPLPTQARVLRVLDRHEFERVGGSKVLKVKIRVVSATNKDLNELIEKGLFRSDLYFRLHGMRIHLPALRERMEDLPALIDYFVGKYASQNSKSRMSVSDQALEILKTYIWPGNVRELERCIEHAVVVAEGTRIRPEHFPIEIHESLRAADIDDRIRGARSSTLPEAVRRLEQDLIAVALEECGGVKTLAAERLGIHESTLRKKMKILGIGPGHNSGNQTPASSRENVRIV
ncbi:MAG: sigma 54-interacting transcriptional regulator [Candidatus Eisenbacteria bacterium]